MFYCRHATSSWPAIFLSSCFFLWINNITFIRSWFYVVRANDICRWFYLLERAFPLCWYSWRWVVLCTLLHYSASSCCSCCCVYIMIKSSCVLCRLCHAIITSILLLAPQIVHRVFRLVSFCCSVKSVSGFCLHIFIISNFIVRETFVRSIFFCCRVLVSHA
jgi:hypothetical protein